MTVSLGVSELMGDSTREEWIKRADEALYSAKKIRWYLERQRPQEPLPSAGTIHNLLRRHGLMVTSVSGGAEHEAYGPESRRLALVAELRA